MEQDELDQTPPLEFEPQPELGPDQVPGISERPPDLISDAEDEDPDDQPTDDGNADEGDDVDEDGDDN
jgi:hypothetical protein